MIKAQNHLKKFFLNKLGLLFSAREKVLNSFKRRLFPIKNSDKISTCEPTKLATEPKVLTEPALEPATEPTKATKSKTKCKIYSLKL